MNLISPDCRAQAREAQEALQAAVGTRTGHDAHLGTVVIRGADGDVGVPEIVSKILMKVLAPGHAVEIREVGEELTTQEAADILNVSRPHLTKLVAEGAIPFRMVGIHRRLNREDVLLIKAKQSEIARKALDLARISQELGLE